MQKIVDYFKQYIGVISIVLAVCILLTYTLSYFVVNTGNKRAAEMYVGELQYSINIDGVNKNTLSVPSGTMVANVTITSMDDIETYYKLLYSQNSNITIKYFSQTKDTSENVTNYSLPSSSVLGKKTNSIKLLIYNSSTTEVTLTFKISGGYKTNTLDDVSIPSGYEEITTVVDTNPYFCTTTDTLTQGLTYVNGQYTYRYKSKAYTFTNDSNDNPVFEYKNFDEDGWSAQVTNTSLTTALTSKICAYINDKPLVNMDLMFESSKATSIDISSLDSSNVTSMVHTFSRASTKSLDLSKLDSSKVKDTGGMFCGTNVTNLDLSHLDTGNVTSMSWMFMGAKSSSINLTGLNTSKVTEMDAMFSGCKATSIIGIEDLDTSSAVDMNSMFYNINLSSLDLSKYNTSNVTDMDHMFYSSSSTTLKSLNISNFDTRNVIDMKYMFGYSELDEIDLSSFELNDNVELNSMFSYSTTTVGYAKNQELADKFNASSNKPTTLTFVVKN